MSHPSFDPLLVDRNGIPVQRRLNREQQVSGMMSEAPAYSEDLSPLWDGDGHGAVRHQGVDPAGHLHLPDAATLVDNTKRDGCVDRPSGRGIYMEGSAERPRIVGSGRHRPGQKDNRKRVCEDAVSWLNEDPPWLKSVL